MANFLDRQFGQTTLDKNSGDVQSTIPDGTYRFIALDVETANRNHSSICQLGLACVGSDGVIHKYSQLIDPEDYFEDMNVSIHGIDQGDVYGAPNFTTVLESLRPILERHVLVQHSNFDKQAMNAACSINNISNLRVQWMDSVVISRVAWPEFKGNGGHGLAHLKAALGLDFVHHDAGEDARAAAEVVLLAEKRTGRAFEELAKGSAKKSNKYPKSISMDGNSNGHMYGHVVCFTGSLTLSRTEVATLASDAGIAVKAGISKKVSMVVVGDQDLSDLAGHSKSSKHRKAEDLQATGHPIEILGEQAFLALLENKD